MEPLHAHRLPQHTDVTQGSGSGRRTASATVSDTLSRGCATLPDYTRGQVKGLTGGSSLLPLGEGR